MLLTEAKLKRMILEEQAKLENRPVEVTPEYLNSLISEEFERVESRRRIQEAARYLRRERRNSSRRRK
jgi:hypothetical protein